MILCVFRTGRSVYSSLVCIYGCPSVHILLWLVQGGIAFIAIKGVAKLYYKQQQYVRQAKRQIRNFEESTAQTTEL